MDTNPFQSPAPGPSGPVPTGTRPTSLLVLGILNIVFGVLGLCGTAASSAMFFVEMPQDPGMPNPALELIRSDSTYRLIMQTMIVLGCLASLALLVGGIGLLLVNWLYLLQPMLAQGEAGGLGQAAAIGGAVGGMIGGCFSVIYPVVLLIFMYRPAVRAAVAPPQGLA